MRRVVVLALLLSFLGALPCAADELYVRNRPFKGPMAGAGLKMEAGLALLVEAVGLKVESVNGGLYVAGPKGRSESGVALVTGAGVVVVGDTVVPARTDAAGNVMVPVKAFADALGLLAAANKDLGTVDVSVPANWGKEAPPAGGAPAPAPALGQGSVPARGIIPPIVVNTNAGQVLADVDQYVVRGRFNFVYYYGGDTISKETTPFVKAFAARNDDVAVIMVNCGTIHSPLSKKLGIRRLPQVVTLMPNLARIGTDGAGHGVKQSFETDGFLNQMRQIWNQR